MLFIYSLYGMVKVQFIQCAFRKDTWPCYIFKDGFYHWIVMENNFGYKFIILRSYWCPIFDYIFLLMSCKISVFIIGTGMYNYKVIQKTVYRNGTRVPQCITFWNSHKRVGQSIFEFQNRCIVGTHSHINYFHIV